MLNIEAYHQNELFLNILSYYIAGIYNIKYIKQKFEIVKN